MRSALVCPKCEGRKFWRIERAVQVLRRVEWSGSRDQCTFEAFACAGCGFTEWYASGLDELREDPRLGVTFIDNEPKTGMEGPLR